MREKLNWPESPYIELDFASVGATENLMMAASLIPGKTEIRNAAMEPEINDLADFLNALGAHVSRRCRYQIRIVIEGVKRLHGATHDVIADRIETGTYMIVEAMTGKVSWLLHAGLRPDHLKVALIAKIAPGRS